MSTATATPNQPITITPITSKSDISPAFSNVWATFGVQTPDAICYAYNPTWSTPTGYAAAVSRTESTFTNSSRSHQIFLKATTLENNVERIVGFAIWIQLTSISGNGAMIELDGRRAMNAEQLYPDDEAEQGFLATLFENLYRPRHELVLERARVNAEPPAVMCLDLCVVHPDFQRRGIASRLVEWGLEEAKRRNVVCCLEASVMGRPVYQKLGFEVVGGEIEYGVQGAKFAEMGMPVNVFMQTR